MKRIFLIMTLMLVLTGCNNKEEKDKNEYLDMKSKLLEHTKFLSEDDLTLDIVINVDRETEEKINYEVVLSKPKENMKDIKAIVVHNYYTENKFITIGIFDKTKDLLKDSDEKIVLKDTIDTTDDIKELELELKFMIKYTNDNGEKKTIYYKTT